MSGEVLRCLWCKAPLSDGHRVPAGAQCVCGVRYSDSLLRDADRTEWDRALRRDGYRVERDGDATVLTVTPLSEVAP